MRAARVYIAGHVYVTGHAGCLCAETAASHLSHQSAAGTLLEGNLMYEKIICQNRYIRLFYHKKACHKNLDNADFLCGRQDVPSLRGGSFEYVGRKRQRWWLVFTNGQSTNL